MRLVVGLGNPGPRYARTRHNVGFRLVERLAGDAAWRDFQSLGRCAREGGLWYAEPLTYMNESGRFVGAFARFHRVAPPDVLVCFDDVALPLGRLRLRSDGSAGGHNGMASVLEALGTKDVPRLRIGIGPQPAGIPSENFVLARFSSEEEAALPEVLEAAGQAVETAAREGLEAAMNRFNRAA